MHRTIYIDTAFTDLVRPVLLSLGMVTSDGKDPIEGTLVAS